MMKTETNLPILQSKLKEGNLTGLYVFTGEETFNKEFYLSRFKSVFEAEPMAELNVITLDLQEIPTETAFGAIESYPVMSDKKLVIIKNSGIFAGAPKKEDSSEEDSAEESDGKGEKKDLSGDKKMWADIFENPPEYAAIIFDESKTDKRNALYKKFVKNGLFVEFNYLQPAELSNWIVGFLGKRNHKINKDALAEFMLRGGLSMANLAAEAEKLCDYCGDREIIEKSDVEQTMVRSLQDKVFDMMDGLLDGNRDAAFRFFADLKALREEPLKILALISSNTAGILKVDACLRANVADIKSETGLHPFVIQKNTARLRRYPVSRFRKIMNLCLEADRDMIVKGYDKWTVLETLAMEISKVK